MNTKPFLIIFCSSVALMVIGAIVLNILESSGIVNKENIGPKGTDAINGAYLVLFLITGFSIVPLFVRLFIVMQLKIGNGEFIFIRWFQAHEQGVVYGFWSILIIGLCIIFYFEKGDILKNMR